ncbi:MAG: L,D-transpeptidase [Chloroflexi bacterium]|nr:L,D-transpeptidase [Chloroflexota bacterium]
MRRERPFFAAAITVVALAGGAADRALASGARLGTGRGQPLSWRSWAGTEISALDPAPAPAAQRPPFARTSTAGGSLSGSNPPKRPPDELLSNETTATRWAYVAAIALIHTRATAASPPVTRLHWYTEDRFPEIYLLLRAHWDTRGQEWVLLRVPRRPNGTIGWVRRETLGAFHLTHEQIVLDRSRLRIRLYQDGRLRWSGPVAVGKPSTPTPAGYFWIRERFAIADRSSGYCAVFLNL